VSDKLFFVVVPDMVRFSVIDLVKVHPLVSEKLEVDDWLSEKVLVGPASAKCAKSSLMSASRSAAMIPSSSNINLVR
jgi:hypothetical protein